MSMAINIRDLRLNERIEQLAKRQPTPLERAVMARSILEAGCAVCEQTGNPLAWMNTNDAGSVSETEAQQSTTGRSVGSVSNQSSPASKDAQVSQPVVGATEAGAAEKAA